MATAAELTGELDGYRFDRGRRYRIIWRVNEEESYAFAQCSNLDRSTGR
jgi:hypothetical protein